MSQAWEVRQRKSSRFNTHVVLWNERLGISIRADIEGNWERTEVADLMEDGVENVRVLS